MQAEIKLKSDIPVHQREYRVPYALQEEVDQELLRMWNHGVIETCTSAYSSPWWSYANQIILFEYAAITFI